MTYGYDVKVGNKWYKAGEEIPSLAKPIEPTANKEVDVVTEKKRTAKPKKSEG